MSTAVILLFSIAALFIFKASGMLMTEAGEDPDFSGKLLMITALMSFFGLLISIFVGWFLRVVRA
jgi:hypothetical protein|nr:MULTISPECIES: hypothetical protein [Alteromonas]